MPAQRKLLADVVSGVDRTAWEGSARETAAAAHKAARAHAVERVRESGASVAATVLEGETWPAVGEHARKHTVSVHGEHLVLYITEWSDDFENNRYTLSTRTPARSL